MDIGFLRFEPERFDLYARIGTKDANNWSMSAQEGLFLCGMLTAIRAARVVEIGTNIGHSTLYISHALRAVGHPDAVVHSFETSDRARVAREHLRTFGYDQLAHVHEADSRGAVAERVRAMIGPVDAVLIDGDHSFEGSYADFCFWRSAVRPSGLIFFHDISEEFEDTYLQVGLRSVHTTLKSIEARHPDYKIIRLEPPHYHNVTSMAVVQTPARKVPRPASRPRAITAGFWDRVDPGEAGRRPWETVRPGAGSAWPPSMLQEDELRYLYWLARDVAPDDAVVVLGAWQGGSTAFLAQGVRDRAASRRQSVVHSFDRFVWDAYSAAFSPAVPLRPGDDMEGVFLGNTRPWADIVRSHRGEIQDAEWTPEEPIGLLFIDAVTDREGLERVWNTFGRALRPGAIVVFQDFKHYLASFLPVLVPLLPGLTPAHACRNGCSVAFRFDGPFRPVELPAPSPETVEAHFRAACEFFAWDPPTATALQHSWISQLLNLGAPGEARALFAQLRGLPVASGAADAPAALGARLAALE